MPSHSPSTVPSFLRRFVACSLAAAASFGIARASAPPAGFTVLSTSVTPPTAWEINRPIDVQFSAPVDFASVNVSTVRIEEFPTGAPAAGDFTLVAPDLVRFQPRCPTRADLSDAGFSPGHAYVLRVLGPSSSGPVVTSSTGMPLSADFVVGFGASQPPQPLFLDTGVGPPSPVIRGPSGSRHASRIELGNDPRQRVDFEPRAVPDPALGADVPAGFRAPLNLASAPRTSVAIVVVLDQMIALDAANTGPSRVRLELESAPGTWEALARDVTLVASCTPIGATLRVQPLGVLPQDRRVRVVLGAGFADVVGDALVTDVVVGSFQVAVANDPGTTTPGDAADERFEGFDTVTLEDRSFAPPAGASRATWGADGKLEGAAFDGSGGPNGAFDWVIETGQTFVLDTTFAVITDATQTTTENVVNGRVDVRSLWVKVGGVLVVQGPNPCTIVASGLVPGQTAGILVEGRIEANGRNNPGVVSFGTANIPEPGALGTAGGGRGGTGSFLTTQSTPFGGAGFGAFDAPNGGGEGGETGFHSAQDVFRRPGGGGGGRLGHDQNERARPACPDQRVIGLDAERGFDGAPQATGALPPVHMPPNGGRIGPSPFTNASIDDDFWGLQVTASGVAITGELARPIGGSGGGAGGDACRTSQFPTTPFTPTGDQKGAGGGGGGGVLVLRALGPIRVGGNGAAARARIAVNGGNGGGGENTSGLNRIGGGSGGGSGGHLVLESASSIDLSQLAAAATTSGGESTWGGLFARGGQGGAGENNVGGSGIGGAATNPSLDQLPASSYPNTTSPCGIVAGVDDAAPTTPTGLAAPAAIANPPQFQFTNSVGNLAPWNHWASVGGDGGPGLIQLHAPTLADIVVPLSAVPQVLTDFRNVCMPLPVGATPANANDPSQWGHMLPSFGRFSSARSRWMALGAPDVAPGTPVADAVDFVFGGTNPANGSVLTSGVGTNVPVQELAPIASGVLVAGPALPSIAGDQRSVLLDGSTVDDLYRRNPNLLRGSVLRVATSSFVVGAASYSASTGVLRVYVEGSGTPLAGFAPGASLALIPRFFVAGSGAQADVLAEPGTIRIAFQVAPANAQGLPDEAQASSWITDATQLGASVARPRFLRFRVDFDAIPTGALGPATPQPFLDFLRIAFRF